MFKMKNSIAFNWKFFLIGIRYRKAGCWNILFIYPFPFMRIILRWQILPKEYK